MQRIAIAGATGYIGGRLTPRLLDSGYALRCLVRSPQKLEGREWTSDSRVEIRQTNLADTPSLTHELSGCDAAFYLVHSMMSAEGEYATSTSHLHLPTPLAMRGRDALFISADSGRRAPV